VTPAESLNETTLRTDRNHLFHWIILYVPALFRPALLDDADSGHAESAKEMVETGDWVTLHL
jgi:hypothetical protein